MMYVEMRNQTIAKMVRSVPSTTAASSAAVNQSGMPGDDQNIMNIVHLATARTFLRRGMVPRYGSCRGERRATVNTVAM